MSDVEHILRAEIAKRDEIIALQYRRLWTTLRVIQELREACNCGADVHESERDIATEMRATAKHLIEESRASSERHREMERRRREGTETNRERFTRLKQEALVRRLLSEVEQHKDNRGHSM